MTKTEKTAVAMGFFDGMHLGHAAVFDSAYSAAEKYGLVPATFMIRGETPLPKFGVRRDIFLTPYEDKVSLLKNQFGMQYLYTPFFSEIRDLAPEFFFERDIVGVMNAGYVCCGEDFRFGKGGAGNAELIAKMCESRSMKYDIVPPVCEGGAPVSSTRVRELIRAGDMESASKLLGRDFSYKLPVLHGKQLGRTMGFPTINQEIPFNMVHPKHGVYASRVIIDGTDHPAITNIGTKPTVKNDDSENMETHIIGFTGDLYDREIRVYLLSYMRGEQKFDSLGELKAQLESDLRSRS